ncbi:MAG: hypothetical protein JNJ54_29205 [Myxococcaceae bacterium]|nr:hypothetical protein [Myxococcaceae bacterium]
MPLTKEEEATLAELEAEVAAEAPPLPKNVRPDRFSGFPVGMADDGTLFPLEPAKDDDEDEAAAPTK